LILNKVKKKIQFDFLIKIIFFFLKKDPKTLKRKHNEFDLNEINRNSRTASLIDYTETANSTSIPKWLSNCSFINKYSWLYSYSIIVFIYWIRSV